MEIKAAKRYNLKIIYLDKERAKKDVYGPRNNRLFLDIPFREGDL